LRYFLTEGAFSPLFTYLSLLYLVLTHHFLPQDGGNHRSIHRATVGV
jgi:hypothetical protein